MKRLIVTFITIFSCLAVLSGCDLLLPYTTTTEAVTQQTSLPEKTQPPASPPLPSKTSLPAPVSTSTPIPTPTPTIQLAEILQTPTLDGYIPKEFEWDFGGTQWTWSIDIPEEMYEYYKSLPRSPTRDYSIYVTHPFDDIPISSLAESILENAEEEGFTEYEAVYFAISFVQSLPYASDSVDTGYDEYPRYPVETLVNGGGDCEDSSILAASLLRAMGYGVVLLVFPETADSQGHCAVGLAGEDDMPGTYWKYGGRPYYYLETTDKGWHIGQVPEEYQSASAHVYPMMPIPVLTHTWTTEADGLFVKLEVTVENLGSADASNVYVMGGFDAGNDRVWNQKTSDLFDLGVDESVIATLYLLPPYGEYTRILVQIIYNGYAADESYSDWFDT